MCAVPVVAITAAVAHARGHAGPIAHAACGTERWSVKTLSDADARRVNLVPSTTTVAKLGRLPAPATLPDRRLPAELRYRIHARLVAYKLEDDGDVHLVVADPASGATMIVEFPNSGCTHGAPSADRHQVAVAKRALIAACGPPTSSRFTTLHGTATISGVLFFDFKHGQRGVAPNAVELHPVIGFVSSDCGAG